MSNPEISHIIPVNRQIIAREARQTLAKVVASEESLDQMYELSLFNPMVQAQRFKDFDKLKSSPQKKEIEENPEEVKIIGVEGAEEMASRFQGKNPELNQKTLLILRDLISEKDSPEEILQKVFSIYPDPSLADEALDFLIEAAPKELAATLTKTKELLNRDYERQVKSGRNIGEAAREFSKEGLGSPTSLRDMYRDVTGNPREPLQLFNELAEKYPYSQLKSVIGFLLHSLGSDLKAKGPSIPRAELARLIEETRSLQGILGIFRFFHSRAKLIHTQFTSHGLSIPSVLSLETLSRIFVKLLSERYINPEKIKLTAKFMGISESLIAQIIIYSQMYEAIRQIAPRYYRNTKHKNEFMKAFVDVLEELEDVLEKEKKKKKR